MLEKVGFQKLVFEDFYEVLESLIQQIIIPEPGGTTLTSETLLEAFQSPEGELYFIIPCHVGLKIRTLVSNSVVVYLRLVASAQIRNDPEEYAPFLFHPELGEPMGTREFCEHFVEAVGKEAGPWLLAFASLIWILVHLCGWLWNRRPCADDRVDACFEIKPQRCVPRWAIVYRKGRFR